MPRKSSSEGPKKPSSTDAGDQSGVTRSVDVGPSEGVTGSTASDQGPATQEWVRKMIDRSEERLENKIDQLKESIDKRLRRLDSMPTFTQLLYVAAALFAFCLTSVLAILAFGGDRFDGGVAFTASTYHQSAEARRLSENNAKQIQEVSKNLDVLIKLMGSKIDGR
jgi:hypothetical protein